MTLAPHIAARRAEQRQNGATYFAVAFKSTFLTGMQDRESRWDLIAAIANDAASLNLPITGVRALVATKEALEQAGCDYSMGTVKNLAVTAKLYDNGSTEQKTIFETYGWTIVRDLAKAGWTPADAANLLGSKHRTRADVASAIRAARDPGVPEPKPEPPLGDAWRAWLNKINGDLIEGARLAERSDTEDAVLDTYSAFAQLIYQRITERKLDAELREFFDSPAGGPDATT